MTPGLVERVAEALAEADAVKLTNGEPWPWRERSKTAQARYRTIAQEIIDRCRLMERPQEGQP